MTGCVKCAKIICVRVGAVFALLPRSWMEPQRRVNETEAVLRHRSPIRGARGHDEAVQCRGSALLGAARGLSSKFRPRPFRAQAAHRSTRCSRPGDRKRMAARRLATPTCRRSNHVNVTATVHLSLHVRRMDAPALHAVRDVLWLTLGMLVRSGRRPVRGPQPTTAQGYGARRGPQNRRTSRSNSFQARANSGEARKRVTARWAWGHPSPSGSDIMRVCIIRGPCPLSRVSRMRGSGASGPVRPRRASP